MLKSPARDPYLLDACPEKNSPCPLVLRSAALARISSTWEAFLFKGGGTGGGTGVRMATGRLARVSPT